MNLSEILSGFNTSINEEQAWAICHQYAKIENHPKELSDSQGKYFIEPVGLESIVLAENGQVSFVSDKRVNSEREIVEAFGQVLLEAIEFGIDQNEEEKELSPGLERLIERMTLSYDGFQPEEDEGYDAEDEDDIVSLDHGPCTLDVVVKLCEEHLETPNAAEAHYLAVCRALITEAVDLKSFLENVSNTKESLKIFTNLNNNNDVSVLEGEENEFPDLNFSEWAHLWIQVVGDLRCGVKLKKVAGYTRNVEYELTPYEILMEDIRQRNFTLKKVAINGDIVPRLKHDAHDIILDFIKSRPTLNPSKNRRLRPLPPRSKSLHELLLEQIHENSTPLRHIEPPVDSPIEKRRSMEVEASVTSSKSFDLGRCGTSMTPPMSSTTRRRLIKAPTLLEIQRTNNYTSTASESDTESISSDISDDELLSTTNDEDTSSRFKRHSVISTSSLRSSGTSGVSSSGYDDVDGANADKIGIFKRNTATIRRKKLLSVELLPSPVLTPVPDSPFDTVPPLRQSSYTPRSVGIRRANSMAGVRTPSFMGAGLGVNPLTTADRRMTWRDKRTQGLGLFPTPESTVPLPPTSSSPLAKRDRRDSNNTDGPNPPKLHRAFSERRQSVTRTVHDAWRYPLECLALTVEELIHIRKVLARAELEKYQGRGDLYTNLKKGKICFNCRIRKFSLLWWASSCQICQQKICSKCMRKVRTPTNEYLHTPVYTLSPSLNPNLTKETNYSDSENSAMNSFRFSSSTSTSVLRERNEGDGSSSLLRQQYRTELSGAAGTKSRKMDVCEECCDLISRIIQTNQMATLHQSPNHRNLGPQITSPEAGCWPYTRQPPVTSQMLRRSASTANHMSHYRLPYQNGPPSSASVRGLQDLVK